MRQLLFQPPLAPAETRNLNTDFQDHQADPANLKKKNMQYNLPIQFSFILNEILYHEVYQIQ